MKFSIKSLVSTQQVRSKEKSEILTAADSWPPITVFCDGRILDGHHRVDEATSRKHTEIEVISIPKNVEESRIKSFKDFHGVACITSGELMLLFQDFIEMQGDK